MDINELKRTIADEIARAKADIILRKEKVELDEFKAKFLGKKSLLTSLFASLKNVEQTDKKAFGELVTNLKKNLSDLYSARDEEIKELALKRQIESERIDITKPGRQVHSGSKHPFYAVIDDVTDFFIGLGFEVAEGPEVESELNNFELMNIPADHPARDMQDSFSIDDGVVLRSHTSAVQARVMASKNGKGPIKVICPGKVFRRDNDATHSHQFGQIEGLVISENVTFSNLMDLLRLLLRHLFGEKREVRFRPSYFPFTEPSIEADISCFECAGKGCSLCKNTGWIEVLGAGMVHPNVLRMNGFDDKVYQGIAFGVGVDRIAMLKYGIDDIKKFYTDDVSFLSQFTKE